MRNCTGTGQGNPLESALMYRRSWRYADELIRLSVRELLGVAGISLVR